MCGLPPILFERDKVNSIERKNELLVKIKDLVIKASKHGPHEALKILYDAADFAEKYEALWRHDYEENCECGDVYKAPTGEQAMVIMAHDDKVLLGGDDHWFTVEELKEKFTKVS